MSVVAETTLIEELSRELLSIDKAILDKQSELNLWIRKYEDCGALNFSCKRSKKNEIDRIAAELEVLKRRKLELPGLIQAEKEYQNQTLVNQTALRTAEAQANPEAVKARGTANVKKFLAIGGAVSIVIAVGIFMFFKYRK